jgi:hypothetical protein
VGRTYLVWGTFTNGIFVDGNDILIDITARPAPSRRATSSCERARRADAHLSSAGE